MNMQLSSKLSFGLSALVLALAAQSAQAQSRSAISLVGVANNGYIYSLDQTSSAGAPTSASVNQSFTGMDGAGDEQTMGFTGQTIASSQYGQLHCYTTATLTNSYYNAGNTPYADPNGDLNDANGSPTTLTSLGFAIFDDILQFGGNLQAGYKARYIFHIDGTNSGDGAAADLGVDIDGHPGDAFFDFDPGSIDTTWATSDWDVNGITPQTIHVQFSNQVVFNTYDYADGTNLAGTSDFSATVTLSDIEVVDGNGNYVTGWTVSSASGTIYPTMQAVPEPCTLLVLGIPALLLRKRRK